MPPPDGDEQLAQQHTDDGAHGNGQNGGQRLPVRGQGDGGEYDGQGDERHGDVGQAFEKAVASRYPEGPLRIREPLPQGQKRRKHRQIAQQQLGWTGGSLEPYAPGCCIGGSRFGNYEGLLPEADGRTWTECDINTLGAKSRGPERIVFSNDGLIYYTGDHYQTFELLYGG